MLKLVTEAEERFGVCLADMARNGRDDEACRVLCAVAARLHAPRPEPLPELIPLPHWFRELEPAAATHGGPAR